MPLLVPWSPIRDAVRDREPATRGEAAVRRWTDDAQPFHADV